MMSLPCLTLGFDKVKIHLVPVCHYHPGSAWAAMRVLHSVTVQSSQISRANSVAVALEMDQGLEPFLSGALPGPREAARAIAYDVNSVTRVAPLPVSDAFTQSLLFAHDHGLPVHCVDLPSGDETLEAEPRTRFPDPWGALLRGSYVELILANVEDAHPVHQARERQMAANLLELAKTHSAIVAVIGAGHMAALQRLLTSSTPPERVRPPCLRNVRIADVDGSALFTRWLGPLPALAFALEQATKQGELNAFSPHAVVERLLCEAEESYSKRHTALSLSLRMSVRNLLWKWTVSGGCVVPGIVELVEVARAVVDEDFSRILALYAWGAALSERPRSHRPLVVEGGAGRLGVSEDDRFIPVKPSPGRATGSPIPLPVIQSDNDVWWVGKRRTRRLSDHALMSDRTCWDNQVRLYDATMRALLPPRRLAVPWTGGPLRRPDLRAMERALSSGKEEDLWVRRAVHTLPRTDEDDSDPLVILFECDLDRRQFTTMSLGVSTPEGGYFHTSANLVGESHSTSSCSTHFLLARAAFTSPHLIYFDIALGAEDQARARHAFSRWLNRNQNAQHLPVRDVFYDDDLPDHVPSQLRPHARACPPWELITMSAILYARHRVVYVAPEPPARWLRELSQARRIPLHFIPLRRLGTCDVEPARTYTMRMTKRS